MTRRAQKIPNVNLEQSPDFINCHNYLLESNHKTTEYFTFLICDLFFRLTGKQPSE